MIINDLIRSSINKKQVILRRIQSLITARMRGAPTRSQNPQAEFISAVKRILPERPAFGLWGDSPMLVYIITLSNK
jgi:hypothetical protein